MQTLFFMFSIFLSAFTMSNRVLATEKIASMATPPLTEPQVLQAGLFQYQGNFQVELSAKQEIVDRKYTLGEKRYQELRQEGYGCAFKANMVYLCKKNIPLPLTQDLRDKVNKKYALQTIRIGDKNGAATLLDTWSEDFAQWRVNQRVEFSDMSFNDYVMVQKPNYWGAWFTRDVYHKTLQMMSNNELQQSDEFWMVQGSVTLVYYVRVIFEK